VGDGDDPGPQFLGHLICLFTLIINIYGFGDSYSYKSTYFENYIYTHFSETTKDRNPLPEVNLLMVEIPTPNPYIFMIRVDRQIKCPKS
jgi:hypothetical protein